VSVGNLGDPYPQLLLDINFEDDPIACYRDIVLSFNPLLYYRLDELSGTSAIDSSASGFTGTYTGGFTLNQASILGDGNPCASFNGSTGYVDAGSHSVLQSLVSAWTLAAWVYPTATRAAASPDAAGIICYERTASHIPFALAYGLETGTGIAATANQVWAGYFVTSTGWEAVIDPTPPPLNTWTHYVVTQNDADNLLVLYRNGIEVARHIEANNPSNSANLLKTFIGRRWDTGATGTDEFFPGRIDDPCIVDYTMNASQVFLLYTSSFVKRFKDLNYVRIPARTGQPSRVRSFSLSRGRQNNVDRIEAGQATVVCDNRDAALTPDPIVNLAANPSFETDTDNWSVVNGTKTRDSTRANVGTYSCKLSSTAGSVDVYLTDAVAGLGSMRPGKTYTVTAFVFLLTGEGITAAEHFIRIIDEVQGDVQTTNGSDPTALDAWQRVAVTATIRADADKSYLRIGFAAGASGEDMWIDNIQVEEVPDNAGDAPLNFVTNPSFETDTSGWTADGSVTLARSTAQAHDGTAAMSLVPTANNATSRAKTALVGEPFVAGVRYRASVWIYATGTSVGKLCQLLISETGGATGASNVSSVHHTLLAGWNEYTTNGLLVQSDRTNIDFYVGGNNTTNWQTTETVYVDTVRVWADVQYTDYCDGDQADGRWFDEAHRSVSHRKVSGSYRNILPMRQARLIAKYGPDQLVTNGGFEKGTLAGHSGWTRTAVGDVPDFIEIVTGAGDPAPRGKYRWRVEGVSSTESVKLVSEYIVIDASQIYVLAAQFYRSTGGDTPQCDIRLLCYDQYRNLLGSVYSNETATGVTRNTAPFDVTSTATWEFFGGRYNGQTGTDGGSSGGFIAGTRYVQVELWGAKLPTTLAGFVRIDAVQLTKSSAKIVDADYASTAYYPLMEGFITSYDHGWPGDGVDATCTLQITDGFRAMNGLDLSVLKRPSESVAARVTATLQAGAVPADRIHLDTTKIDSTLLSSVPLGSLSGEPLQHIRQIEETELGLFFQLPDGHYVYQGRLTRDRGQRERAVFADHDLATNVPYSSTTLQYDEQNIENDKRITNPSFGVVFNHLSAPSQRRYFPRTAQLTSLWAANTATSRNRYEPLPRFEPLSIKPRRDPRRLWPIVLDLEISDLVRIDRTFGREYTPNILHWIEGVSHQATPNEWIVGFPTTPSPPGGDTISTGGPTAVAVPTVRQFADGGGGTTDSIPSMTYSAGKLYLILTFQQHATTTVTAVPTLSGSGGWATGKTASIDVPASTRWWRHTIFWKIIGASDVTEAITITAAGGQSMEVSSFAVIEISYGFAGSPIGVTGEATNGSGTSITLDLGTFTTAKGLGIMMSSFGGSGPSQDTTWTGGYQELGDLPPGNGSMAAAYGLNAGDSVGTSNSPNDTNHAITGLEIKAG